MNRKIISMALFVAAFVILNNADRQDALVWMIEMIPVGLLAVLGAVLMPKEWKKHIDNIVNV